MSSVQSTPESITVGGSRVLACQLCKRRKLKCERVFPCAQCIKAGQQCVPSTAATRARKSTARVPGSDEHVHQFPANPNTSDRIDALVGRRHVDVRDSLGAMGRNLWTGLGEEFQVPLETPNHTSGSGEDQARSGNALVTNATSLLLGTTSTGPGLHEQYPPATQASVLWLAFLDNVNPVTKIVHVPSIYTSVDTATRNIDSLPRASISLVFSIYFVTTVSLTSAECERMMGERRSDLLKRFQEATHIALVEADLLSSEDITVLQAFVFYLLALRQLCPPPALWIMTGLAMRMAQRLRLHRDGSTLNVGVFESEMRRRLWWQIVILDNRASQLSGQGHQVDYTVTTSDTDIPLNIDDDAIGPNSTDVPTSSPGLTEMAFCLIRYEFGQFLRDPADGHKLFDPTVPLSDKHAVISSLESDLELRYLRFCDPSNPLHLISSFMARSGICKLRLQAHHPRHHQAGTAPLRPGEDDVLFTTALKMTEQFNVARSAKSIQRYLWHMENYFQLDAFVLLLVELTKRPQDARVHGAWEQVDQTLKYQPQILDEGVGGGESMLYTEVRKLLLRAWMAREKVIRDMFGGENVQLLFPEFVGPLKTKLGVSDSESVGGTEVRLSDPAVPQPQVPAQSQDLEGDDQSGDRMDEEVMEQMNIGIHDGGWAFWDELLNDHEMLLATSARGTGGYRDI